VVEVADIYEEQYCHQACPDARTCASWLNHAVIFMEGVAE
jgi:hypothetical protein